MTLKGLSGSRRRTISGSWSAAVAALTLISGVIGGACTHDTPATTSDRLEQQYGVPGAYTDTITTPEGSLTGTVVPVKLSDGRMAKLVIPPRTSSEPHGVYLHDESGLHPIEVSEHASRDEVRQAPTVVATRPEPPHPNKRSWEKDALIIGGSAGAGTVIGAVAGGGKGAAVGATAGGIGGLIYDLATRNKR